MQESGTLQGPELLASLQCGFWEFDAAVAQLDGTRQYDGQTNAGSPVVSQSTLRQSSAYLQAIYKLSEAWGLGARVSGQTTLRDISSAGGASGYPERFDWTLMSVGAQWSVAAGGGQLNVSAWTGTAMTSGMTVNLPGRDPASLALGAVTQSELSVGWRLPLQGGWDVSAQLRYIATDIGQGTDSVIRRGGIPVGVAHQPRTSLVETPLILQIAYEF